MPEAVFVASSKQFYPLAESIVARLEAQGVRVFHPYFHLDHQVIERDPSIKPAVTLQHFPEIDGCDVLYALLPEGYIGCSVTIEVSYAYARGKRVVVSEPPNETPSGRWSRSIALPTTLSPAMKRVKAAHECFGEGL